MTLYPVSLTPSAIPLWNAPISHKNSADSQQSASYDLSTLTVSSQQAMIWAPWQQSASYDLCTNTCSYNRKYTAHFCQLLYTSVSSLYFTYSESSHKPVHREVPPCFSGCAMAQAVGHRPPTMRAQVQSQATPHGICGKQSNTGMGFLKELWLSHHYNSTNALHSLIYHWRYTTVATDTDIK